MGRVRVSLVAFASRDGRDSNGGCRRAAGFQSLRRPERGHQRLDRRRPGRIPRTLARPSGSRRPARFGQPGTRRLWMPIKPQRSIERSRCRAGFNGMDVTRRPGRCWISSTWATRTVDGAACTRHCSNRLSTPFVSLRPTARPNERPIVPPWWRHGETLAGPVMTRRLDRHRPNPSTVSSLGPQASLPDKNLGAFRAPTTTFGVPVQPHPRTLVAAHVHLDGRRQRSRYTPTTCFEPSPSPPA